MIFADEFFSVVLAARQEAHPEIPPKQDGVDACERGEDSLVDAGGGLDPGDFSLRRN